MNAIMYRMKKTIIVVITSAKNPIIEKLTNLQP